MLEFGSDFHRTDIFSQDVTMAERYEDAIFLADGRQAIELLIKDNNWFRLWMPEYYCYEVINSIRKTGIEIVYYSDYPGNNDRVISWPQFENGDVLLRMNYFGHRSFRDESKIPIPVIEDHSHSPFGPWATQSNADWCVASLRKTLPIPEGGMLWSPKGLRVSTGIESSPQNEKLACLRWQAMTEKSCYLRGEMAEKEKFRLKYLQTEEMFDCLPLSLVDGRTSHFLHGFDVSKWFEEKKNNWMTMLDIKSNKIDLLLPEAECDSFSYVMLCESKSIREQLKAKLIERSVYPAILWNLPESVSTAALDFSQRMLSVHCDARYDKDDIGQLVNILNQSLRDV